MVGRDEAECDQAAVPLCVHQREIKLCVTSVKLLHGFRLWLQGGVQGQSLYRLL